VTVFKSKSGLFVMLYIDVMMTSNCVADNTFQAFLHSLLKAGTEGIWKAGLFLRI